VNRSDWINAVSAAAILIGLMFVLVELRQSRDIAEAQLSAEVNSGLQTFNLAIFGETAAAIQAKACYQPTELTPADIEVLTAVNRALLAQVRLMHGIQRHGLLTVGSDFEEFARWMAGGYLGTTWGRYQWTTDRKLQPQEYADVVRIFDEVRDATPKGACVWREEYEGYLELARSGDV